MLCPRHGSNRPSHAWALGAGAAALLMLLANLCVAGIACTIRVAPAELHLVEIAFFRNLFGLACQLPFLCIGHHEAKVAPLRARTATKGAQPARRGL